jgi:hypothetical protein
LITIFSITGKDNFPENSCDPLLAAGYFNCGIRV